MLARDQHRRQSLAGVLQIAGLLAKLFAMNDQFAGRVQTRSELLLYPPPPSDTQSRALGQFKVQRNPRVGFVDVLPAGTATSRRRITKVFRGDGQPRIDHQIIQWNVPVSAW